MKTPFDFLIRFAPPATPEDIAEAARLGVDINTYRSNKHAVMVEQARQATDSRPPPDIAEEQAVAQRLRRKGGLFKRRNTAPNILEEAWKAPGGVAKGILFVACYLVGMFAFVILGGEKLHNQPWSGLFEVLVFGVMVIPVMWLTNRLWEGIGEGARDVCRALVRFWPVTLIALLMALGGLRLLFTGSAR
jgi:hypothetical protein